MSVKALYFKNPVNGLIFPHSDELEKRKDLIPIYTLDDLEKMTTTDLDTITLHYVKELKPDDFNVNMSNMERMSKLFQVLGFKEASVPVGMASIAVPAPSATETQKELTAEEIADSEQALKDAAVLPAAGASGKIDTSEPELSIEQQADRIGKLVEGIGKLPKEGFRSGFGGIPLIKPLADIVGFEVGLEEMKQAFEIHKEKKAAAEDIK